jgi:ribosomal protein S18 acetylase RimI-like enzyme
MIECVSGDGSALDLIGPLWEKLRAYHVACATDFSADMAAVTFSDRKKGLLEKAGAAGLCVDRAVDRQSGSCVGYCVSSIDNRKRGEVESIYVEEAYRDKGIGAALMGRALDWLREQNAQSTVIYVVAGNEQAIGFYAHFGFRRRAVLLAQPKARAAGVIGGMQL